VHVLAGINSGVTILDVLDGGLSLKDAIIEGPSGLKLICGASGVARLAAIDRRQREQLGKEIWRLAMDFDVVVLDTAAGIGIEVLSLLALADQIVVVATPNVTSTLDAYGVIKASHEAKIGGQLGVLANHAKTEAEAEIVRSRLSNCAAQFLGVSLRDLGWLPRAPRLEAANRNRQPVLTTSPGSDVSRRFRALAAALLSADAPEAGAANQSAAA
jgi:flagellar biosynthesis protein FlhG